VLRAGVDVVRLNFAHGEPDGHRSVAAEVRAAANELRRPVGILVDLPGPKMRTGDFSNDSATLAPGAEFVLDKRDEEGDARRGATSVVDLPALVSAGDEIYLADGEVVLRVESASGGEVRTKVLRGGTVRSRKGMHLPEAERQVEAFTPQDREALKLAVELGADMIGLSFVRDATDLKRARESLPADPSSPQLVAKIETGSAIEHLDEIVDEADAVMVARGDLGIQTPLRRVPLLQKQIIRACNLAGKPVITATEMLESMTEAPLPSRAEVNDVANAVFDGTDALMLSEETAVGSYPTEAVETMAAVALTAEERQPTQHLQMAPTDREGDPVAWAVAHAAVQAAGDLDAEAILCVTQSGSTARRVAAYRPQQTVAGLAETPDCFGGLTLVWGVVPLNLPSGSEGLVQRVLRASLDGGVVKRGDLAIVVAGTPGPRAGATDYLRIVRA
jgi:pyruvate kinase